MHFLHVNGVKKPVPFYSLDVIISVGYRVKSKRGTDFRIWARKVLKQYLIKGYVINKRIVPAFAHYVDVHDAAWARDLEFLMLVDTGLHLDGVGFLGMVAVLGGGAFQYGSRQITLVIFSACPKHVRQQNVIAVSRIVTVFI